MAINLLKLTLLIDFWPIIANNGHIMSMKAQKMAVLSFLRQYKKPMSSSELIEKLEPDCASRSMRRWLNALVQDGFVEKIGDKRGTRYQAISVSQSEDESRPDTHSLFSPASQRSINKVRKPLFERNPISYDKTLLEKYIPNKTKYLTAAIEQQLQFAGHRLNEDMPAGTYARKIFHRLLIDLSYNSSRLEGNTYSLIDTQRLLEEGTSAEGKLDEETIMVLNHKEAIRYLVERIVSPEIKESDIYTLHYLLADGLIDHSAAGKIRETGVRIGGSTYVPYEQPQKLKRLFTDICEKSSKIKSPFEQSFFLLVHLSYLQAFADVNKRTARLAANIPLIRKNIVPLSFKDIEIDDYISAILAIYECQDMLPLRDLYVNSYLRDCKLYDTTIESLGIDKIRVLYRQQRRDILRHIIENELTNDAMHAYIDVAIKQEIPAEDQANVLEDLEEDLRELDIPRIAGIGISVTDYNRWKSKTKK